MALVSVALLIATHYLLRKTIRKNAPKIVRPIVERFLRPLLTIYYRRKVTNQIQAERKAGGMPLLENPNPR